MTGDARGGLGCGSGVILALLLALLTLWFLPASQRWVGAWLLCTEGEAPPIVAPAAPGSFTVACAHPDQGLRYARPLWPVLLVVTVAYLMPLGWLSLGRGGGSGGATLPAPAPRPPEELPQEVAEWLATGQKIHAIKRVREVTGMGLKEAKAYVERIEAGEVVVPPPVSSGDPVATLAQLDEMHKRGLITQAEYDQKKREILARL